MTVAVRSQTRNYGTASPDRPAPITNRPDASDRGDSRLSHVSFGCLHGVRVHARFRPA
jgi:hypothetical protein